MCQPRYDRGPAGGHNDSKGACMGYMPGTRVYGASQQDVSAYLFEGCLPVLGELSPAVPMPA